MLPMKDEDCERYERATRCGNCDKLFNPENYKVRHHCHITGDFLFACCNSCNLQLKPIRRARNTDHKKVGEKRPYQSSEEWAQEQYEKHYFLPVLFHNLKNYDAHLLIKQFHHKYTEQVTSDGILTYDDVKVIPLNGEKYLQFEIGELRFLDSFQSYRLLWTTSCPYF